MADTLKRSNKPQDWRDVATATLRTIANNNQYIVSDMLIVVLNRKGIELDNYSSLGALFSRAAKEGLIEKYTTNQSSHRAKTIWRSLIYHRGIEPRQLVETVRNSVTQEGRILNMIKRPQGATNWELSKVALKYGSRIYDLRRDGYNIHRERQMLPNGRATNTHLYTLIKEKAS